MQLAVAVICTGLAASLFGLSAADATIAQVLTLPIYWAGLRIIDIGFEHRGPTDRNKPY